jgi:hypothetical protein
MRFRSARGGIRLNVVPPDIVKDQYGRKVRDVPGLVAVFGRDGIFDSLNSETAARWTNEQRLEVERAVMSHPQFRIARVMDMPSLNGEMQGNMVMMEYDLAPGQTIPEEHKEFVTTLRWWQQGEQLKAMKAGGAPLTGTPCAATIETVNGQEGCTQMAVEGSEFCAIHSPVAAEA